MNFRTAAGYFLAFWSAASLGALSFIGMFIITASWPWALLSFFLASVIEGEIYKQSILQAIDSLTYGPILGIKTMIAKRQLKDDPKYLQAVNKLERKKFIEASIKDIDNDPVLAGEVTRKTVVLYISGLLAIGAGISSGLATLSAATTGLLTLGATAGAALASGAVIAILSSIGYTLMMYKSVADMVQNDTLHHWYEEIGKFFHKDSTENYLTYLARTSLATLGVLTVSALATFATIATAGTWWYAAKNGALLISGISEAAASIIRTITVIAMWIPNFIFNVAQALESVRQVANSSIDDALYKLDKHYLQPLENKNLAQWVNPFYWIGKTADILINGVVFIGHLISVGLTSDGLRGIPPLITTAAGTIIEFLTDWHFIFGSEDNHKHHHHHHHHQHSSIPQLFAAVVLSPITFLAKLWEWSFASPTNVSPVSSDSDSDDEHEHHHDHDHDHHHDHSHHGHSHSTTLVYKTMDVSHAHPALNAAAATDNSIATTRPIAIVPAAALSSNDVDYPQSIRQRR